MKSGELLEVTKAAAKEQLSLRTEKSVKLIIEKTSIDCHAFFDKEKMMQVLLNLLSNATKFTPQGSLISISFAESTLNRGRRNTDDGTMHALSISVKDEGPGIPDEELELIFDKFVQSRKTRGTAGGTGLGLAISRKIVLAHGGNIKAQNHPLGGAVFAVTLPKEPLSMHTGANPVKE